MEDPATSWAWLVLAKMLTREIASGKYRVIVCDMCGYGTAFKKPTRLLLWGKFAHRVELRLCNGKRGLCGHSGVPHLQLTGVQNGLVLTHHAQVYCKKCVADVLGQLLLGQRPLQYRRRCAASTGHTL